MPESTWAQKLSGSTVLFVVALVCFIVGWVTNLKILTTIAYVLFIAVALMGLYALCCTTRVIKGAVFSPSDNLTTVHVSQNPPFNPPMSTVYPPPLPPSHQTTTPGFRQQFHYPQDQPPSYNVAIKQNYP